MSDSDLNKFPFASAAAAAATKKLAQEEKLAANLSKQLKASGQMVARLGDPVLHPLPPVLTGSPGSPNVLIGGQPAWRGLPQAQVANLEKAKKESAKAVAIAEAVEDMAAGTSYAGAAKVYAEKKKLDEAKAMAELITAAAAGGTDIHVCATPLPPILPLHGPGVVTSGSSTVLINGLPACRMGDTIQEAIGPKNIIMSGNPTIIIGG